LQRGIGEPDLKVVVGGETFFHNSVHFCRASTYFDRMLASNMRESNTMTIEFPHGDPETWVRLCRYVEPPRSIFPVETLHVTEEDAKNLLPWFHLVEMINLLEQCDVIFSVSSPKFLGVDENNVDHLRSTMTEIMVWAETATTYDLPKTLGAMMNELKKAVNAFPEIITTEIIGKDAPFLVVG
jgi:hypothetical protein